MEPITPLQAQPSSSNVDNPQPFPAANAEALRLQYVRQIRAALSTLQGALRQRDALQREIAEEEQRLASLGAERQEIEAAVRGLHADVGRLNEELDRLRSVRIAIQENLEALETRRNALTSEVQNLEEHHPGSLLVRAAPGVRHQSHLGLVVVRWLLALVVLVVFCGLVALLTDLPTRAGWWVLPVTTTGMEPALPQGSSVLLHAVPVQDVQNGDIIAFIDGTTDGQPVLGRVTGLDQSNGQITLGTRSDATGLQSSWYVPDGQPVQRVMYYLPQLGTGQAFLQTVLPSMAARLAAIALAFLVLVLLLWPWGSRSAPRRTPALSAAS